MVLKQPEIAHSDDGIVLATVVFIKHTVMIYQFFFQKLSAEKQVAQLKRKGVALGTRAKNGRKIFVYMLGNLFAEVMYMEDNSENAPERVNLLRGLKNLNQYLESEFRTSF
jgi:hypothetical protein